MLEKFLELLVGLTIVLNVADVLHVDFTCLFLVVFMELAVVRALMIIPIVISLKNTVLRDVSHALIHPATFALVVIFITVDQLLHRVLFKVSIFSLKLCKALNNSCGTECPASSTYPLVIRLGHKSVFIPIFVLRNSFEPPGCLLRHSPPLHFLSLMLRDYKPCMPLNKFIIGKICELINLKRESRVGDLVVLYYSMVILLED